MPAPLSSCSSTTHHAAHPQLASRFREMQNPEPQLPRRAVKTVNLTLNLRCKKVMEGALNHNVLGGSNNSNITSLRCDHLFMQNIPSDTQTETGGHKPLLSVGQGKSCDPELCKILIYSVCIEIIATLPPTESFLTDQPTG